MNAPFRPNPIARDVVRLLADHDDGRMNGARIAQALPRRWRRFPPYGRVALALVRLETAGWVTSEWEADVPAGQPRRRFYHLREDRRSAAAAWLGTAR